MTSGPEAGLPAGWGLELDRGTRRTDGGRVLIGGSPFRVLRLSPTGAELLGRLSAGDPLPRADPARRLARRLVNAALAHPRPPPAEVLRPADVSVVIPVRDEPHRLGPTIAALGSVREIVVVDDGSTAPAAVRSAAGAATVLRHDRPRGPAAARNVGWRSTTGTVVAFVDADVTADAGWLPPLLAHLGDPAVGAVAPRVRSSPGDAPGWLAAYEAARSPIDLGPTPALVRPRTRVAYVPTALLVVRRAALEDVDGLDEHLLYGEDVDLVWRLDAAGWRVRYEPVSTARHPVRPDLRAWLEQRYRYGSSAATLAARHGDVVAPLGTSGWSAAAWGAVLVGHPLAGAALASVTTAALVPKLDSLQHPAREALRIAGGGHLWAGRSVADALRRPWWPLSLLLAWAWPRSRPALVAAATVPALLDWQERSPALDPLRFAALRLLDDLAYGTGVWAGCLRARSGRALVPGFTGPIDPPATLGRAGPGET
ncbi:MAG: mycofactocin biosynthesis glycosyltransferase MftF [Acidimicrobiales bacterium]